ncbi:PEP-CTERM sorting domain-containing protein [Lacipirellula parvula]|uniref:Ice-binding protein C-terminal domain-containing protein n=1 Tax=Lacipirellula parvula TaxID=2650471 RepID=A0A5K7XIV3_9BACT|nr:PEP-CTERM sorting domain-containing protein [Lacipirellula parvula]BBO32829.1 hypothetical protein PLANPX_2441 [Lacipirellula parvula]
MKTLLTTALVALWGAATTQAAIIDTFTRADGTPVTNSVGVTEVGGIAYVERNNSASGSTVDGTAAVSNNKLLITGQQNTTLAHNLITGGAYLPVDYRDVRVGLDLEFLLSAGSPTGSSPNQFNNTFLLMLRSRVGQNFGTTAVDHAGLVAIEMVANGAIQVREQRGASNLVFVRNANPFTGLAASRDPLPGVLPANFGSGTFDVNQNGYLDVNEPVHFEAALSGTSLNLYVNGVQYGDPITLALTSAATGQINGIGLQKNRIGGTLAVGTDLLVDNLDVTVVPEPASAALAMLGMACACAARRRQR